MRKLPYLLLLIVMCAVLFFSWRAAWQEGGAAVVQIAVLTGIGVLAGLGFLAFIDRWKGK